MFLGEFRHSVDDKKRLAIPSKFRSELGQKAVLTIGFDKCLFLFPQKEWEKLAEKLSSLPLGQTSVRELNRLMLAGAAEVEFDRLGRILIPDYLVKYANLKKKTVVAGLYNRIEIWSEDKWDAYKSKAEKELGNLAEKLGELGV